MSWWWLVGLIVLLISAVIAVNEFIELNARVEEVSQRADDLAREIVRLGGNPYSGGPAAVVRVGE